MGQWVDIVVVTPESAYWGVCFSRFNHQIFAQSSKRRIAMEIQMGALRAWWISLTPFNPPAFSPTVVRLAFSRTPGEMASLSGCVKSSATVKQTVLDSSRPRYDRPSDRFGPPTALFNRKLVILMHDLECSETLTLDLPIIEMLSNSFYILPRFMLTRTTDSRICGNTEATSSPGRAGGNNQWWMGQ